MKKKKLYKASISRNRAQLYGNGKQTKKTTNFTITTIKQQQSVEGAQNEIIPAPPVLLLRGAQFAHTKVWLCCLSTKLLLLRQTGAICLKF